MLISHIYTHTTILLPGSRYSLCSLYSLLPTQYSVMCGRYGFGNPARLGTLPFGTPLPALRARFNVAPTYDVPQVRETSAGRDALLVRWGLVPFWADDPSIGNRLANARGDTVAAKPSFRAAFKARRGLMPADLFYEWQAISGQRKKRPFVVRFRTEEPFALGGIWEFWRQQCHVAFKI